MPSNNGLQCNSNAADKGIANPEKQARKREVAARRAAAEAGAAQALLDAEADKKRLAKKAFKEASAKPLYENLRFNLLCLPSPSSFCLTYACSLSFALLLSLGLWCAV